MIEYLHTCCPCWAAKIDDNVWRMIGYAALGCWGAGLWLGLGGLRVVGELEWRERGQEREVVSTPRETYHNLLKEGCLGALW